VQALASDPSGTTSATIVLEAVATIKRELLRLVAAGARTFVVPNAPDLALVPALRPFPAPARFAATGLARAFNARLQAILTRVETSLPVTVFRVDVFALLHEIVDAPQAFGLSDVENACITPSTTIKPFCARAGEFLFWDGINPTRAGHAILAGRARAALAGP